MSDCNGVKRVENKTGLMDGVSFWVLQGMVVSLCCVWGVFSKFFFFFLSSERGIPVGISLGWIVPFRLFSYLLHSLISIITTFPHAFFISIQCSFFSGSFLLGLSLFPSPFFF